MMDSTYAAVARLRAQGASLNEISRRVGISQPKVRKILITIGAIEDPIAAMYAAGSSIDQIAEARGISRKAVLGHIPYSKGLYGAEYPSKNALRIRKCRSKSGAEV